MKLYLKAFIFKHIRSNNKNGGAKGDRTPDLLHAMQALSQLSYGPGLWNNINQKKLNTYNFIFFIFLFVYFELVLSIVMGP